MTTRHERIGALWTAALSPGAWVIALLAIGSGIAVLAMPVRDEPGLEVWIFAFEHGQMYEPVADEWTAETGTEVNVRVFGIPALARRVMGGFFSGIETADLIECERQMVGPMFAGPVESVGFTDLTERIEAEGLMGRINAPSFTPWMSRGRVFGLPHDVHPVLLGYRSDIVEAAGIDMSEIETWDDFQRVLRPLMADTDGDGRPDRYLLSFWENHLENLEVLLLQGGGSMFDMDGVCTLGSERNAEILAEVLSWCMGDDRFCTEINEWSNAGHMQTIEGYAIGYLMPDWMCGIWMRQMPQLEGTVKLMPLPAFEPGGRRTSVRGGSMMGIPKTTDQPDVAWELIRELYLSRDVARELYESNGIISPVTELWDDPMYDEPSAFFSGQAVGRAYIGEAPNVPPRPASPYYRSAQLRLQDAAVITGERARAAGMSTPEEILPLAREALADAQASIERQMARNVFIGEDE
ncbi:MAG: hypothetical protein DHS20C14_04800 [Phycisphaeraceae bacterium]|nr:MAG: hypothetical protein DHS20C14_04800 [Phycisphaeraceae bacterium]